MKAPKRNRNCTTLSFFGITFTLGILAVYKSLNSTDHELLQQQSTETETVETVSNRAKPVAKDVFVDIPEKSRYLRRPDPNRPFWEHNKGDFTCSNEVGRKDALSLDYGSLGEDTSEHATITNVEHGQTIHGQVPDGEYDFYSVCICTPSMRERLILFNVKVNPIRGKFLHFPTSSSGQNLRSRELILGAGDPNLYMSFSNTLPTLTTSEFISATGSSSLLAAKLVKEEMTLYSDQEEWLAVLKGASRCTATYADGQRPQGYVATVFFSVRGATESEYDLTVTCTEGT